MPEAEDDILTVAKLLAEAPPDEVQKVLTEVLASQAEMEELIAIWADKSHGGHICWSTSGLTIGRIVSILEQVKFTLLHNLAHEDGAE